MSGKLAKEWLCKAEEDFAVVLILSKKRKRLLMNTVCFHSQQAGEKYLKSYLALKGIDFPKTHDLILLKNLALKTESDFEFIADLAAVLTPYAVEFRYPGEQATSKDVKMAIAAIKEMRDFILKKLQRIR